MKAQAYLSHPTLKSSSWLLERIQEQHNRHGSIVVGLDWDHTIKCPITGHYYEELVDIAKRVVSQDHILCIWTANDNHDMVKHELDELSITYHYFNNSPIWNHQRKPHFNILLDDVAGLSESYHTLLEFLDSTKD